jgi:hypothetical protein
MARVLVVDDEGVEEAVKRWLVDRGHDVRHTTNVADSLRMLTCELIDVVVLDMYLPRMSVEAFLELSASESELRRILHDHLWAGLDVYNALPHMQPACGVVFHSIVPEFVIRKRLDVRNRRCRFVRRYETSARALCSAIDALISEIALPAQR